MTPLKNEQLDAILTLVLSKRLGSAVSALQNYLYTYPHQASIDALGAIADDYRLMADYWKRGFDDPEREAVSSRLLRRLYVLVMDVYSNWRLASSTYLKALHVRPRHIRKDWSMTAVRAGLEAFVSDVALLELEPEQLRQQREQQVYQDHWQVMRDLFDYIVTSRQWKEGLGDAFIDMLLSPTLASVDQQLIVSAVTLSCLQGYCFQKFRILIEVYRQATDQALRQRALVGWVLNTAADRVAVYPEMATLVGAVCSDDDACTELTELQIQLLYCLSAEDDTNKIQNEILPDIIEGSRIQVTRKGLVEMDEDSLSDILHPDAAERDMERVEQSMHRMADMQQQGADIYFGGFSQMKRFPFFSEISNWFVPFYPQHPGISQIWSKTRGKKFLKTITRIGAFCDSDKYSFVLAFDQVLDRLPKDMVRLVEQGEATPMPIGGEVDTEEQKAPAFMRRMYLQNLYRFYKLYGSRAAFTNPFATDAADASPLFFFSNPLFSGTPLEHHFAGVAGFMMKRHRYAEALSVLQNLSESHFDFKYHLMMGNLIQHLPTLTALSAEEHFRKALEFQPDSERALAGYARALFAGQRYAEALEAYDRLMALQPDSTNYQLNASVCMLSEGRTDEALKLLYKLDYMQPGSTKVEHVLAWALTVAGKYEQADRYYTHLLEAPQPAADDLLNYGYRQWMGGNVESAISLFRQFITTQDYDGFHIADEFIGTEHSLLLSKGITDTDISLMLDALE